MDTQDTEGKGAETRSGRATGYAEWAQVAGFLAAQTCPWECRERVAMTPSIKRSLRTKKPNRTKKPSNAAKVNAKRTKQAAKRAQHNKPELSDGAKSKEVPNA